ncbi:13236_t:CDS:2, partial [Racocetra fulgida]
TIEDRVYKESRALFLRTRNNTTELYEELAARILNTKRAHPEIPNLTKKIGSVMDNLRYQVNKSFEKTAKQYRVKYGNEISNQNLYTFIDDNVWRNALHLPLLAVNKMAVDDNEVIKKGLKTFVIEMVKQWVLALHEEKDAKGAIKEFDELTLDLPIPTNYNIVARLPVRKLLQYKK